MLLKKFLNENADWYDKLKSAPYNLNIANDGDFWLFKYNQISSDMSLPMCQEARGIIFKHVPDAVDPWTIVCQPFNKFFNLGEPNAVSVNFKNSILFEKVDGCLDANTVLYTENGNMTIQNICDTKYKGKVLSYNTDTLVSEFDTIVEHSIQKSDNNWYEITLDNDVSLKLTGNHMVWLPELRCYRRVDELNGTEKILLKK